MEQWKEALDKGNRIRIDRANLKRDIAQGKLDVADVFQGKRKDVADAMPVSLLLEAAPRFGPHRAATVLKHAQVSGSVALGRLSEHSREQLVKAYRGISRSRAA